MNATLADPVIVMERRWFTYMKAGVFVLPALIAWAFACTFLAPKANEIFLGAGWHPAGLDRIWSVTFSIIHWGRAVAVAAILVVAMMEFMAPRWWRRRLAVGIGVWLANVTALVVLCLLLVIVLAAAPSLAHAR